MDNVKNVWCKESVVELAGVEEAGLGPDSEALRLAALLSFRPSFQASLPASLWAFHSRWLCGDFIYIPPTPSVSLWPCSLHHTFLTLSTVLNFPEFSNFQA